MESIAYTEKKRKMALFFFVRQLSKKH